jgi:hypothetical protein
MHALRTAVTVMARKMPALDSGLLLAVAGVVVADAVAQAALAALAVVEASVVRAVVVGRVAPADAVALLRLPRAIVARMTVPLKTGTQSAIQGRGL